MRLMLMRKTIHKVTKSCKYREAKRRRSKTQSRPSCQRRRSLSERPTCRRPFSRRHKYELGGRLDTGKGNNARYVAKPLTLGKHI